MSYGYRNQRFGPRDNPREWRESDWRALNDDPRVPAAENAVGWLLDRGILETVGLAPDGELLMRLSEQASVDVEPMGEGEDAPPPPPRPRTRARRRSSSAPRELPADAD